MIFASAHGSGRDGSGPPSTHDGGVRTSNAAPTLALTELAREVRAVISAALADRELAAGLPAELQEALRAALRIAEAAHQLSEQQEAAEFVHANAMWTLSFAGETIRLRDSRGLACLQLLLCHPGERIHSLVLAAGTEGWSRDPASPSKRDSSPVERVLALREEWLESRRDGESHSHWKAAALVRAWAEHADSTEDTLAGDRAVERARLLVTRAIHGTIKKIARYHEPLGSHLHATIRTGRFCAYLPDARVSILWRT